MSANVDLLEILFGRAEGPPQEVPTVKPKPKPLHFYRCADCLAVVTVTDKLGLKRDKWGYSTDSVDAVCGACGGEMEYMGQTAMDRLVKYEERCACDERCQGARGPNCDCRCGGENHGKSVWVTVVKETGAIPVVQVPPDARVKAEVYRQLYAEAESAIDKRCGLTTGVRTWTAAIG